MSTPNGSPDPSSDHFEAVESGSPELAARPDDLDEAVRQLRAARVGPSDDQRPEATASPADDTVSPAEARDLIVDFCRQHPDALHRSCLEGHLTGSGVVVDPAGTRTLLLHHAKLDRWLQPGGHADGDGNLAGVAWREATEETGIGRLRLVRPAIDIDIHRIPARPGEPEHLHLDLRFAVVAPEGAAVVINHESLGARWVEPGDDAVDGAPDLARAVSRALAAVRQLR